MLHRAYVLHKTAELDQMPDLGADSRAQLVQELEDNAFDPSTGPGGMRKRSAVSHSWRMPFQMQGCFSASAQKRSKNSEERMSGERWQILYEHKMTFRRPSTASLVALQRRVPAHSTY